MKTSARIDIVTSQGSEDTSLFEDGFITEDKGGIVIEYGIDSSKMFITLKGNAVCLERKGDGAYTLNLEEGKPGTLNITDKDFTGMLFVDTKKVLKKITTDGQKNKLEIYLHYAYTTLDGGGTETKAKIKCAYDKKGE